MSTIKQVIDTSSIEIRNAQTSTVIPPGDISITLAASTAAQVFGNFSLQRSSTTSFGATLVNILVPYIVSSGTLTSVTISLTRIVHQDGVASVTTNIPLSAPTPAFRLVASTESLISVPITTPTIDNQSNAFSVSYLITLTFTATTNVTLLLHGLELDYSLNIPQTVTPVVVSSGPTTVTPTTNYTLVILDTSNQALTNVTLAAGVEGGVVDIQLLTKRGLPANVRTMPFGSVYLDQINSLKHLIFTNGQYRVLDEFTDSFYVSAQQGLKLVGTEISRQGRSVSLSNDGDTLAIGGITNNDNIGATWVFTRTAGVWTQQGAKLVGTGAVGAAAQGTSVSLSADGNTLVVGGSLDNTGIGATWVFTRTAGVWTQQGAKLVGTGAVGAAAQGTSVSLSADGNTLAVGGNADNTGIGATWVFTRTAGVWTQQGAKLVGAGAVGAAQQGISISLSADGNTLAVGGFADNTNIGATWVFTRTAGVWTQQGAKLVGAGAVGAAAQGFSVSLSADGNTLAIEGSGDNASVGATWVFTRTAGVWTQQGAKLITIGQVSVPFQTRTRFISLSADGNTLAVGDSIDNINVGATWVFTRTAGIWTQQGAKLVGSGAVGVARQGTSVSLSADGNTLSVGGPSDNGNAGATWVFTRTAGVWTQQGAKLFGTEATSLQGFSVSLSADENTLAVGGPLDNTSVGATWVFTRTAGVWTQQGAKLVGAGAVGAAQQGISISLSADGNTLAVGGEGDNTGIGATWVFTRTAGVWTQQGAKLVGTGAVGASQQGLFVSLSADGNTLAIGGPIDNSNIGTTWVFTRTAGVWTQQGAKLIGSGAIGTARQGISVSLSADGNTLAIGGLLDNASAGATWVFTRTAGIWTQQGAKLVGTGAVGVANQGTSVSLSADGNTLAVGGVSDSINIGATWVFTRTAGIWTQQGAKLVGTNVATIAQQGTSVSLSADGNTLSVGGPTDNLGIGATWVFTRTAGVWTQQGAKLVGTGAVGAAQQGRSVSISAYGNVLAIGGQQDNINIGATWLFV